jgi:hypothetical protein
MAATSSRKPARKRPAPDPVTCHLCPESLATETELVIHLVESHGGIWTSTNSFDLDDLMIPTPRSSDEDQPAHEHNWVRRLIRRSA